MRPFFLSLLFLFFLILESFVVTLPLVFLLLISLAVILKQSFMFLVALVMGILIDILAFNVVGKTSLFFITVVFLMLIYQRRFEIENNIVVGFVSFLGSIIYFFMFGLNNLFFGSVLSFVIGLILFNFLRIVLNNSFLKTSLIKKDDALW